MQESGCTCVEEGAGAARFESVLPGESNLYHWRVQDFQGLDNADGERRRIAFDVEVCQGSAHVYVKALDEAPAPSALDHHFSAVEDYGPNSIAVLALRGQFYVAVSGADTDPAIVSAARLAPAMNGTSSSSSSAAALNASAPPVLSVPQMLAGYSAA